MVSDVETGQMLSSLLDWKKVRTPPSYRVSSNTLRLQAQFVTVLTVTSVLFLIILYNWSSTATRSDVEIRGSSFRYDPTYPLSEPARVHGTIRFPIGVVADMDHSSKSQLESNTWLSYFLKGTLIWNPSSQTASFTWDKNNFVTLKTSFASKGRGMELSELVTFNGQILTFDDRSGLVYKLVNHKAIPWIILLDGDGNSAKGFKSEWATVKDQHLYVGSMGKEWTTPSGQFVNTDPMFVKRISVDGEVTHLNWKNNYLALRERVGIHFPGYMLHESAQWSDIHRKWFFLPRRMSKETYNEETDEHKGTNILLSSDENFRNIQMTTIGDVLPTHGFSSFKFIPGTNDEVIVALKTTEVNGKTATYIMVFTIHGKIISGETKIDDVKYEGLEFL